MLWTTLALRCAHPRGDPDQEGGPVTFFWFAVAYLTSYGLGRAHGQAIELHREERAIKKVENRTLNVRDIREHR